MKIVILMITMVLLASCTQQPSTEDMIRMVIEAEKATNSYEASGIIDMNVTMNMYGSDMSFRTQGNNTIQYDKAARKYLTKNIVSSPGLFGMMGTMESGIYLDGDRAFVLIPFSGWTEADLNGTDLWEEQVSLEDIALLLESSKIILKEQTRDHYVVEVLMDIKKLMNIMDRELYDLELFEEEGVSTEYTLIILIDKSSYRIKEYRMHFIITMSSEGEYAYNMRIEAYNNFIFSKVNEKIDIVSPIDESARMLPSESSRMPLTSRVIATAKS
jgi:hypothetical protein